MAKEKTYKLALTLSELEMVYLEFESCLGVGGEDPAFRTLRDKACEMLRKINRAAQLDGGQGEGEKA